MNKNATLCITFIAVLWTCQQAFADDLTIPHEFNAGQPARAVEVNANFDAVEASVDNNAAAIATNEAAIQSNTAAISGLAASGGLPVYSNGNRIGRLVRFMDDGSLILIQSDTGYMFASEIAGGSHLTEVVIYFSETGCSGTIFVRAGTSDVPEWAGRTSGYVVAANWPGPEPTDAYYVPRGSTAIQFTSASRLRQNICEDATDSFYGFTAIPNDEATTGVPKVKPSLEYYIGMP